MQHFSAYRTTPCTTFGTNSAYSVVFSNMSIAEFFDGIPSFDERNFLRFQPHNGRSKPTSVYISTVDTSGDQMIVNEKTDLLLRHLYNQWDKELECEKEDLVETFGETSSKVRR